MHLGSLESTQEARVALLLCSPNFPRASITRYTHAKREPILNCRLKENELIFNFKKGTLRLCSLEMRKQSVFQEMSLVSDLC